MSSFMETSREFALDTMPERHREYWNKGKNGLIYRALTGCGRAAVSYRNFKVGCAMLSYNPEANDYAVNHKGNYKPEKKREIGAQKRCAERSVLESAANNGDSEVVGFVVASSQTQPELEAGVHSDILCPCEDCRQMFAESPLIKPWTKILLMRLDPAIDNMDRDTFYEELGKIEDPQKVGRMIQAMKEMSYVEFIQKFNTGKI